MFDEKFIGLRSPVFGEGTQVRSPERVPLERISYSGTAYLAQKGSDVEGFVAIEGDTLMLTGIVTETKNGTRWLGLDFEGDRQKEARHGIMTAALNGNESTGDFLEVGQKCML